MTNFYEILNINIEVTTEEVKKAYLSLSKKFPLDRFQKEFLRIREAYEILIDKKIRKEYDSILSLSEVEKENYGSAIKLLEDYNIDKAIKSLERLIKNNPDTYILRFFLGKAYLENDNTGKALKIFEELTKENPDNASFASYLGFSYLNRGWQKKAIKVFEKALELDKDNISIWLGYSDAFFDNKEFKAAKKVLLRALEVNNNENITIYSKLMEADIYDNDIIELKNHLDTFIELAQKDETLKENVSWSIILIGQTLLENDEVDLALELTNKASELLPEDEAIKGYKKDVNEYFNVKKEFDLLEGDNKVKDEVKYLIALNTLDSESLGMSEKDRDVATINYDLILAEEYNEFILSIERIRKLYPNLYEFKRGYFEGLKNMTTRKKIISNAKADLLDFHKKAISEESFNSEDDSEAVQSIETNVEKEQKIGRNEPCPCGSGRKYKKCCGV